MEQIRAFIAVELPNSIKVALAQLQDSLKQSKHASVKWVDPGSIHLTLKFLGNIDTATIPELANAMSEATKGIAPFQLELGELGAFPNLRAPRVVWVEIRGEIAPLSTMQRNIDRALTSFGFLPEKRSFSPHLTLGRVREGSSPGEQRRLGELVASLKPDISSSFIVDSLNLMRSTLTRERALYDCLSSVELQSS